jgi:acyl-CoA dehydrogenase
MIIYGQGAIRCHPFVQHEIAAIAANDLAAFDRALFGHVNLLVRNATRAKLLAWSGSRLARAPDVADTGRYYQHLSRFSAAFELLSDVAMGTLGGSLKRYHDGGKTAPNYNLVRWCATHCLYRIQEALLGVIESLPMRPAAFLLGWAIFPLGARFRPPSDALGARVARDILEDREARLSLTEDMFVPPPGEVGLGALEAALDKAVRAIPVETKLRDAVRAGRLDRAPGHMLDDLGLAAGVITAEEYRTLQQADAARNEVVAVDAFDPQTFKTLH